MIISSTLFFVGSALVYLLLIVGFTIIFKRKKDSYSGAFIGILISSTLFVTLQVILRDLYVVGDNSTVVVYKTMGEFEYKLNNGTSVNFSGEESMALTPVINDSHKTVVIEEVNYKSKSHLQMQESLQKALKGMDTVPRKKVIPENTDIIMEKGEYDFYDLDHQTIDYFFDDEIPKEIKGYGSRSTSTKYWLHYKGE